VHGMRVLLWIIGGLAGLVGIVWVGTRVPARPFDPPAAGTPPETVPVPTALPSPVARYAQAVFGDRIPMTDSAQITGRGTLVLNGLALPARFKFYHDAGNAYAHHIQVTWFSFPVLTVNESYQNGVATMNLPGETIHDAPEINAAAYQALWAEAIWFPALWFTDERVHWEPLNDNSARLILEDAAPDERFTLYFDPQTGLLTEMVAQRYRNLGDPARHRWTNRAVTWAALAGVQVPIIAETQWDDERPWAVWRVEDITLNLDVRGAFPGA
jgi:hypothetical protein